jgi:hypothetical protein
MRRVSAVQAKAARLCSQVLRRGKHEYKRGMGVWAYLFAWMIRVVCVVAVDAEKSLCALLGCPRCGFACFWGVRVVLGLRRVVETRVLTGSVPLVCYAAS